MVNGYLNIKGDFIGNIFSRKGLIIFFGKKEIVERTPFKKVALNFFFLIFGMGQLVQMTEFFSSIVFHNYLMRIMRSVLYCSSLR